MGLIKNNPLLSSGCVAMLLSVLSTNSALAMPIILPSDLNPGDTYRLVFVTSNTRDATNNDIDDYNIFVQIAAAGVSELNNLGLTWTAIASTSAVNARDNTGVEKRLRSLRHKKRFPENRATG